MHKRAIMEELMSGKQNTKSKWQKSFISDHIKYKEINFSSKAETGN